METEGGASPPEGAGDAEATNGGSPTAPTTGGGRSPFDGEPPYGEHRRRHEPTGAVHTQPTNPTVAPGDTTRTDYSNMSSEEALVAMINRAVIESTTQAAMVMHRGDPKAIAAATAGALAQFMDPQGIMGSLRRASGSDSSAQASRASPADQRLVADAALNTLTPKGLAGLREHERSKLPMYHSRPDHQN